MTLTTEDIFVRANQMREQVRDPYWGFDPEQQQAAVDDYLTELFVLRNRMEACVDLPIADGVDTPCITMRRTKGYQGSGPDDYISHGRGWSDAHRSAYVTLAFRWTRSMLAKVEAGLEEPMDVHHECNRPFCVNPDHLVWITRRENRRLAARDTAAKKRARSSK